MYAYALKRLIQGVVTVWFLATATFIAMHSVPGDPLLNERGVNEEIRRNLEERYGLDRPIFDQYLIYMSNMVKGDFGISFTQQNRSVNDIIREHFPVSATLGVLAIVFAGLGGVLWGALTALYRNRLPDVIVMFLVILGISVPSFVIAALSQLALVGPVVDYHLVRVRTVHRAVAVAMAPCVVIFAEDIITMIGTVGITLEDGQERLALHRLRDV